MDREVLRQVCLDSIKNNQGVKDPLVELKYPYGDIDYMCLYDVWAFKVREDTHFEYYHFSARKLLSNLDK